MRYYSGGYGRCFFAIPSALGWTWLLGLNASITARGSRVSISPRIPDEKQRPELLVIATPRDLEILRPGMCVCSGLENTLALHI